jgi:DNA end-binding protein Ku
VVSRDDIIKGYELTRGSFVELSKSELKALEAVASDEITIEEFVPAEAVDPLYIDRSYYLGAGKGGERAYQLLADALEQAELIAIGAYAARGKQYVVMVRPYQTGLAMHQLRYLDEVKPWNEVPAIKRTKAVPAELALARQVIDHLRHETLDLGRYKDEVKERVRALIATKAKGGEITAPPSVERPAITDLMAALKASLGAARSDGGAARSDGGAARSNGGAARGRGANGSAAHRSAHAATRRRSTHAATRARSAHKRSAGTARPQAARRSRSA